MEPAAAAAKFLSVISTLLSPEESPMCVLSHSRLILIRINFRAAFGVHEWFSRAVVRYKPRPIRRCSSVLVVALELLPLPLSLMSDKCVMTMAFVLIRSRLKSSLHARLNRQPLSSKLCFDVQVDGLAGESGAKCS